MQISIESPTELLIGAGAVCCGVWLREVFCGYAAIGPYPTRSKYATFRALQRALVDRTRTDVSLNWFPLDSLGTAFTARIADNGHPISGAVRDNARDLIESAVVAAGFTKFEISPARQARAPRDVDHQHYAPGDLATPQRVGRPGASDVIVGVDIDYYLRNPDYYLSFARPTIFHTFNPTRVSGRDGDSHYRIVDNEVVYDVSGGATWRHEVWDWCAYGEYLEVAVPLFRDWFNRKAWKDWLLSLVGVRQFVYQKVQHSRPWKDCPDRVLVWTIPSFTCYKITWLDSDLCARKLSRVQYADRMRPGWNSILSVGDDGELQISLGRNGEDASFVMPKNYYDCLMGLSSAQSVTARMIGLDVRDPYRMALMGQYFQGKAMPGFSPDRVGRACGPRVHWPAVMEADDAETSFRSYASPLVTDENLVPLIKRWESLSLSLERRVTWARNLREPFARIRSYANEFVSLVVPEPSVGWPYSLEETAEMLDKPSQALGVQQVWETVDSKPRQLIEAFLKNEPTNKAGRIISSFADMRFLLKLSSFTLAFRDQVLHAEHNRHWFVPGGTPNEIAEKVCDYVRNVEEPIEGDFTNFDGSVSAWAQRHVMNAVMLRYFHGDQRKELTSYTDMLVSCPARAKRFDFRYESGVGVKSGSPTTCDLNTVLNAFIQYVSVRATDKELKPEEAFGRIGLAFGDDSLFEKQYQSQFVRTAANLGMNLKVEVSNPEHGITFLARVFPDPLSTTTSFQDPLRTWRKLHLTSRHPLIPIGDAAMDRVEGYLVTDALSPVTSNYCNMVRRYYESDGAGAGKANTVERRRARKSAGKEKPYWLTSGGSWPQNEEDYDLMVRCTAARTGFDEETIRNACGTLDISTDPWAAITLNRDEEPNPYRDHVDGEGPTDGAVDVRVFTHDREITHGRLRQASKGKPEEGAGGPSGETQQQGSEPRPSELPRVHQQRGGAHGAGNRRPVGQTGGRQIPPRGTRAGGKQGERGSRGTNPPPNHGRQTFRQAGRGGKGVVNRD